MSFWESPSIPNKCRLLRTNEVFGAMVIKVRPIGATRCPGKGATRRFTSPRGIVNRPLAGHEPLRFAASSTQNRSFFAPAIAIAGIVILSGALVSNPLAYDPALPTYDATLHCD